MFGLGKLGTRNSWPKYEAEWQLASPCQQPTRGVAWVHTRPCVTRPTRAKYQSTFVQNQPRFIKSPNFVIGSISWGLGS